MSGPAGPALRAVPEAPPASPAANAPESPAARRRPWLVALLAAALLGVSLAYGIERDRAAALADDVASLEAEVLTSQQRLEAAEHRMRVVRAHVDDLAARFGLLQQAVAESPAADD